jgi:dipeptidyl aminopeptidase/acylaminoacyl peptidase
MASILNVKSILTSLFLASILVAKAIAAPPPIEHFTKPEQIQPYSLELSPSGQYYALIAPSNDRSSLIIVDRATNKVTANITPAKGEFIYQYWWVSGSRVVLTMAKKTGGYSTPGWYGELWGLDADGKNNVYLFGYRGADTTGSHINNSTKTFGSAVVLEPRTDEKNTILIGIRYWDNSLKTDPFIELARINVFNGRFIKTGGKVPIREVDKILVDESRQVRVVSGQLTDRYQKLMYRNPKTNQWLTINDEETSNKYIYPLAFDKGDTEFYVSVYASDGPSYLGLMNPQTKEIRKIFVPETADIGRLLNKAGNNNGAYAVQTFDGSGRGGFAFLDKEAPEAQLTKKLNAQFQGELAYVTSFSDDGRFASVFVTSDVNPGEYYIHNRDDNSISQPLKVRQEIDINSSAVMEPVSFKARDGMMIRGWLTVPNEPAAKMPLVVMPHGGPYDIVDRWEYNADAQLLASRGYAVLQVNFRGSGGYGKDFVNAGAKEWGGKMQNDVTDGTRAVLEKYAIDPNRICLFGISYGAYASLMGVAMEPTLYKCAIGYSGVYDLKLMRNQGDISKRESGQTFLNDVLEKDDAWLRAHSPVDQVARIKAPVLLIHGGEDDRAPPAHAEAMRRALIGAGNPPEWVYESIEGHGFFDPKKRLNAYQHIVDFLDKHIGKP